jgi:hypothetical protein
MADLRVLREKSSATCQPSRIEGARIGKIAGVDERGEILVDFPGNGLGPLISRVTSSAKENLRQSAPVGREVLLVFENNDSGFPVIIDTLDADYEGIVEQVRTVSEAQKPEEITVDGKRVILDAEEQIVLRCGKASITLTSAGKIILKGTYLVSRSSGANSIKGGSVQIN